MMKGTPAVLDIQIEKDLLKQAINTWFSNMKQHIDAIPVDVNLQVELLSKIRMGLYENLNQLQHVALIIKVAERLQQMHPRINKWHWHAKQTSHPDYADLTGYAEDNDSQC